MYRFFNSLKLSSQLTPIRKELKTTNQLFLKPKSLENLILRQSLSTSKVCLFKPSKSTETNETHTTRTKKLNYFAALAFGSFAFLAYLIYTDYKRKQKEDAEEKISLNLNEIYEKQAIEFLSNSIVVESIGVPIKITSTESDHVRSINLTRNGLDVFALIAYNLEGTLNHGTVYCKLKMDNKTQTFKSEEVLLKLNKRYKNKNEFWLLKANKSQADDK